VARGWRESVAELAAAVTDEPEAVAAVVAASEGLCTALLLDAEPAPVEHVHGVLARAAGLRAAPTEGAGRGR
jgi:hypothetical protein